MERSHEETRAHRRQMTTARAGYAGLGLAVLFALSALLLQAGLNFPEILVEKAPLAAQVFSQAGAAGLSGVAGLLACGLFLWWFAPGAARAVSGPARGQILLAGRAAAAALALSGLAGLVFAPLLIGGSAAPAYPFFGGIELALSGMAAPLLLAFFTLRSSFAGKIHRGLGLLSAVGLFLAFDRSVVWVVNSLLPVDDGYYGAAGTLGLLALIGSAAWLVWLVRVSLPLLRSREAAAEELSAPRTGSFLRRAGAAGVGILSLVFILVYSALALVFAPRYQGEGIFSEPSLSGTALYDVIWVYQGLFHRAHTIAEQRAQAFGSNRPLPADIHPEQVSASGVPAQFICAPGATKDYVIMYIHGGGFAIDLNDQHRIYSANLSRATGACVLLPQYRLAPDHPYPAGLQDTIQAYQWLVDSQHTPPAHIILMGESAGANLVLTTALSLRDKGQPLPAGLVALSPPTDLTLEGPTFRTKALADPILSDDLARDAYTLYAGGSADPKDPLLSPLFADLRGLPPTLLLAGTQEVLLNDSESMAEKMRAAGVDVKLEIGPGMWHTWPLAGTFFTEGRLSNEHIDAFIRQRMGK